METIDWSTGEILAALEEYGLSDNTLVVFTSDNGPWFEGSSGIYRDRKGSSGRADSASRSLRIGRAKFQQAQSAANLP